MAIYKKDEKFYYKGRYRLADGSWKNYNRLAKGCTTKEEARKLEKQFLMKMELLKYEVYNETITFQRLCEIYYSDKRNIRKSTTMQNDYYTLRKLQSLNDYMIGDIKPVHIEKVLDEMEKKGLSTSYQNKVRALAHKLFNYAFNEDMIKINPIKKVAICKRPDDIEEDLKFWTYEQFRLFISRVDKVKKNEYYTFFNFQYFMGTRKGEALALSWRDIDFEKQTVKINKTIAQQLRGIRYKLTAPKTKNSIRTIKIPNKMMDILKERYQMMQKVYGFNDDFFIFSTYRPLGIKYIGVLFKKYALEVGLPPIRIHDLRHSHASFLINKGANIKAIASRLGDNVETVLNVYTHLFLETENELISIIDENCN